MTPKNGVPRRQKFSVYSDLDSRRKNDGMMDTTSQQILESALSLPDSDRAEIAASLFLSLDSDSEAGSDEAWAAEIAVRLKSIDEGTVELVPWATVMDQMRQQVDG